MALAFDAASSKQDGSVNSTTLSHTITGTDPVLTVGVMLQDGTAVGNVTGITWNGTALTKAAEDANATFSTEIWYLAAPATGTHDIVVSISNSTTDDIGVGAISLTGADQSSPLDASNSAVGFSGTASVAVTTVADNAWVVDCMYTYNNPTVGAGQTGRYETLVNSNSYIAGSTEGPKTPAGAVTMSHTMTSADWSISAMSIEPSSGAAPSTSIKDVIGIGVVPFAR